MLDAISAGIYDHAVGDGRELCIANGSAVTVSAEDGRTARYVLDKMYESAKNGEVWVDIEK